MVIGVAMIDVGPPASGVSASSLRGLGAVGWQGPGGGVSVGWVSRDVLSVAADADDVLIERVRRRDGSGWLHVRSARGDGDLREGD